MENISSPQAAVTANIPAGAGVGRHHPAAWLGRPGLAPGLPPSTGPSPGCSSTRLLTVPGCLSQGSRDLCRQRPFMLVGFGFVFLKGEMRAARVYPSTQGEPSPPHTPLVRGANGSHAGKKRGLLKKKKTESVALGEQKQPIKVRAVVVNQQSCCYFHLLLAAPVWEWGQRQRSPPPQVCAGRGGQQLPGRQHVARTWAREQAAPRRVW